MKDCPKCGTPLEKVNGMFFWRGKFYPGLVCQKDRALYPVPHEEMPPLRPFAVNVTAART